MPAAPAVEAVPASWAGLAVPPVPRQKGAEEHAAVVDLLGDLARSHHAVALVRTTPRGQCPNQEFPYRDLLRAALRPLDVLLFGAPPLLSDSKP